MIIVNHNGRQYINDCLDSLLNSDYDSFEVLVVDDKSSDDSEELLLRYNNNPRVKLIFNDKEVGFAESNNIAFCKASGDVIVTLNMDTVVDRSCLREIVSRLLSDPRVGAVQCKILNFYDHSLIDSAGGNVTPHGYAILRGIGEKDSGQCDNDNFFYLDCVGAGFWRYAIEEVRPAGILSDPDYFFLYYDEVELSWRLRIAGYKLSFAPKAVVYHHRGGVTRKNPNKTNYIFHITKNRFLFFVISSEIRHLILYLPQLLLFELGKALFLLSINLRYFMATIRGIFYVLANLKKTYEKRVSAHSIKKIQARNVIRYQNLNILQLYRILKKSYFE